MQVKVHESGIWYYGKLGSNRQVTSVSNSPHSFCKITTMCMTIRRVRILSVGWSSWMTKGRRRWLSSTFDSSWKTCMWYLFYSVLRRPFIWFLDKVKRTQWASHPQASNHLFDCLKAGLRDRSRINENQNPSAVYVYISHLSNLKVCQSTSHRLSGPELCHSI
jgi:hypothetical protein